MRCKICHKSFKSGGCTGKHCCESTQQCFSCHYMGINQNMTVCHQICPNCGAVLDCSDGVED